MIEQIRVLIADDHPLVRKGIRTELETDAALIVVGEAIDATQARDLALQLKPDVLLLDISMPGPSAIETANYLGTHCPKTHVLILTAYDDEAYVRGLVAAGVKGYVLKDEMPETIRRAIAAITQGDTWFSLAIINKLASQTDSSSDIRALQLGPREVEILHLVVAGMTDRQIGEKLFLAERTVRYDLRRIYDKLGVDGRIEAVARAVKLGLAEPKAFEQ